MANPTKTQYIQKGRALSTQLTNALAQAVTFDQDMNKLGFVQGGSDPITQEDLDAASGLYYPGSAPGAFKLDDWNGGVYAIGKNGTDYRGGEDQNLLKIAQ